MTSPASGGLRAVRAGALAMVAVCLALAAHTLAGGRSPGLLALLASAVGVTCAAVLVTGRRLGRVTATAGLVVVEGLLHAWFSLTSGHLCGVSSASAHLHHMAAHCLPGGPTEVAPATSATGAPMLMLAAHLGAVLLTGVLVAHGDTLLWRLTGLLRPMLRLPAAAPVRLPRGGLVRADLRVIASVARVGSWHLRGPPAGLVTG